MITRDRAILEGGLTGKLLQGCLNEHLRGTERLTRLRDAYALRAPITRRARPEGMPNHQLAHAYARYIVTIASAYLVGAAVHYQGEGPAAEALRRAYQRANAAGVDIELARQAALYGKGVEVIYADGEAQPRSAALELQTAFVVYSDDAKEGAMEEQLTRLKARLPEIADGSQDALLSYLLEEAAAQAAAWLGRPSVPEACESAVVRLAAIAFHRLGMEGESSHTEGGVSAVVDMLPEDIKALLRPYRLAKVGD